MTALAYARMVSCPACLAGLGTAVATSRDGVSVVLCDACQTTEWPLSRVVSYARYQELMG